MKLKGNQILMPKRLTAENGAKAVFMGEFSERETISCPCGGEDGDCEACLGTGECVIDVPVSWSTIKKIYALAVKRFGHEG